MSLQRIDDDERAFALLERRAKSLAKFPGLKKDIAGNPEAVLAIAIGLDAYGLAVTPNTINMAFDWIEGRAEPTSMFYAAVAMNYGYRIDPRIRTDQLAVAHISRPSDPDDVPIEVEFTLEMAKAAHRLDEWVEEYRDTGEKYQDSARPVRRVIRHTVRVDGEAVPEPLPEWAAKLLEAGQVRRFDAWWNYRTDMLWKSAAKRAVKVACPHVLLGGGDYEHAVAPSEPPARGRAETAGRDFIDVEALDGELPVPNRASDEPREWPPGQEPF